MADGVWPRKPPEPLPGEYVGHPTHGALDVERPAVGRGDSRRLLTAVLEGVESQVREVRRLGMVPRPEQSALIVESISGGGSPPLPRPPLG
jgi:hypothetical protein